MTAKPAARTPKSGRLITLTLDGHKHEAIPNVLAAVLVKIAPDRLKPVDTAAMLGVEPQPMNGAKP